MDYRGSWFLPRIVDQHCISSASWGLYPMNMLLYQHKGHDVTGPFFEVAAAIIAVISLQNVSLRMKTLAVWFVTKQENCVNLSFRNTYVHVIYVMERERKKTFKLVRNIINIKKMFKGRDRSRKKEKYDPDQVLYLEPLSIIPNRTFPAQLPPDADRGAIFVRDCVHLLGPQSHLRPGADLHSPQGRGGRDQDIQEAIHSNHQNRAESGRSRGSWLWRTCTTKQTLQMQNLRTL